MTTRLEIVTDLEADIKSNLIKPNGDIWEVRVGIFDPDEFTSLPSIGIWIIEDEIEEDLMDNVTFRRLNMILYGYVDADSMDDYTSFYNLIEDAEQFLYSSRNRRYENTYLGNVEITYGGATEQAAMFVLNYSILYSQTGLES